MQTSSFFTYKGDAGISIAIYSPPEFDGPEFPALAPPRQLLYAKKAGQVDEKGYVEWYKREVLENLDPHKIYNMLRDNVLLCWEPPGKFCHRRIVAEWIEENVGVRVPEWSPKTGEAKSKNLF